MRLLIMNDDTHDDRFCFENGETHNLELAIAELCNPHPDLILFKTATLPDIEFKFSELHPDFTNEDVESCVENLFDNIMWNPNVDPVVYLAAFNEIWEMAYDY